ncbi:hypothetical protein LCGC14_0541480 [marine sediment metagenome]|uniref:Uncharacterized protein n=1 Tax=marine sediment metagenome TaxID=412755 RepID=A0A0F9RXH2_9ZZZZ
MELDFSNTPMSEVKIKNRCFHCKGRSTSFYCWLLPKKKQVRYFYPCLVFNELICPRVKRNQQN